MLWSPLLIMLLFFFLGENAEPSCAKSEQSSCFIYMRTMDGIKGILKRINPGPRMCLSSTDAYTVSLSNLCLSSSGL